MSLKDRINQDIKVAMKNKNATSLRGLRAIKSAIQLRETDGSGMDWTQDAEIKLLQKLVKQRQESLAIYEKEGREDLATIEREEITVISEYLPEPMSDEELTTLIADIIKENGATSMKDMGRVMGLVASSVAGRADGKVIARIVKDQLSA